MEKKIDHILKGVSRSFYLSLRFLPTALRDTLGLAFLLCKIADTIADTELIPVQERLEVLHRYRELFGCHPEPKAKDLLQHFQEEILRYAQNDTSVESHLLKETATIFSALQHLSKQDQRDIRWLVPELTAGMIVDLQAFPHDGQITALPDEEALERYTYCVAGCVGRFWTRILAAHYSFAAAWDSSIEDIGERFGKGLQMVNILRDLPRDLQKGRCYLPATRLQGAGLTPEKLTRPDHLEVARPLLLEYVATTRKLLSNGKEYATTIPLRFLRLRSAVVTPMQLGFQTLDLLEQSPAWLDPQHVVKVSRWKVYTALARSWVI